MSRMDILPPGYNMCPGCGMEASRSAAGTMCQTCEAKGIDPSSRSHQERKPERSVGRMVKKGRAASTTVAQPGANASLHGPALAAADHTAARRRGLALPGSPRSKRAEQAEPSPAAQRQMDAEVSEVKFRIDGVPVPKERPRVHTTDETNAAGVTSRKTVAYTPKGTKEFEAEVKLLSGQARKAVSAELLSGLLRVQIRIYCDRAAARSDIDNVAKAILDGMQGAVYANDNSVDALDVERDRSYTGRPHTWVRITRFKQPARR
ncbi:RusA family crossover junction endodeoxyribonuclease [Euzebya pacifica]|nr:RusA family crossover junction endodeoxyribonuclease [Euzebya pacifica]